MTEARRPVWGGRLTVWLAGLLLVAQAVADDGPRDWLERMDEAVEFQNYEGTLVHMHSGEASVLKIVHRVAGGRVTERITTMDGGGREIIRDDDEVKCIMPDQQSVLVEVRDDSDSNQSPLRGRLPSPKRFDDAHYQVAFAGRGKVAGRAARIIAVRPLDGYRYGYRLWLDNQTAMPLRSQLLDERGQLVEEILFSSIRLPRSIPVAAVQPSVAMDSFTWHRSEPATAAEPEPGPAEGAWRATEMPAGFMMAAARHKRSPDGGKPMSQLVYTDGLASVSVFVETGVAASEQAEGLSQIGAANAYTTTLHGHLITAVGEVPVRTVEMIALSVRPVAAVQ